MALLRDMEGPPEWLQVDRSGDCWIWRGSTANSGYGLARTTEGRRTHAHRLIYEREIGPIPEGMNVLHRCDNPPCVRPDHLFLGSQLANVRDMIAKGRAHFQSPAVRGRSNSSWGGRTPIPTA